VIKTITLLQRRTDLSRSEFHQYWRTVHAPLVLRVPGVLRYVQSRPVEAPGPFVGDIDGVAEVWYEDGEALLRAFNSPEYRRLLDDEINFMGPATERSIFVAVVEDEISLESG
jgi:uncharacterized protein (TIGR02118 family)